MASERERLRSLIADYCLEHGVSDLTLRRVGKVVGSNNRMLLYYFGSKEELVQETLLETHTRYAQLQGVFEALGEEGAGLLDRLVASWRRLSDASNMPFLRLFFEVFGLAARDPARYRAFLDNVGTVWSVQVAAVLESEGLSGDDGMLHGRDGYRDETRKMVSIWAWTTDAVAIPTGELDIATPDMAALAG